jgi:plasmid stabilization system protein ParE
MKRFIVAPEAAQDLDAIWSYIAEDSLDAADRFLESSTRTYECLPKRQEWGTPANISWGSADSYSGRRVTT